MAGYEESAPLSIWPNITLWQFGNKKNLLNDSWSIASICDLMAGPEHISLVFLKP